MKNKKILYCKGCNKELVVTPEKDFKCLLCGALHRKDGGLKGWNINETAGVRECAKCKHLWVSRLTNKLPLECPACKTRAWRYH
jgi:DNA-directed RNA polymerase subunit RPC12/RpoP